MMLTPVSLDVAFSSMLITNNDIDSELRHKRHERMIPHPNKSDSNESIRAVPHRQKTRKNKHSSQYDLQCNDPYASTAEEGPRCTLQAKGKAGGTTVTCPHCMHVLGLVDPDEIPSAGMPFANETYDESYPTLALVDEMAPVHDNMRQQKKKKVHQPRDLM